MRLSTRFRYGLRLMIDLAQSYKQGPLILKEIAKKERVSKKYLEQIVLKLMSAKLIKSIRGPKGGYVLNKQPEKIKVLDIYKVLEEKSALLDCLDNPSNCSLVNTCRARVFYLKLQRNINNFLSKQDLRNLAKIKHKIRS